jgi:nucleotidyltransferase substrate binding protein (TIGR01987 family)
MEGLKQKYEKLSDAIESLHGAVLNFSKFKTTYRKQFPPSEQAEIYKVFRDSLIQRFEYTTDLFWKYLKVYLETNLLLTNIISPATAIQQSCASGLLTELEGHQLLAMVKGRNKTSHIYVEEVAEQLAIKIPSYYQIMESIKQKISPE